MIVLFDCETTGLHPALDPIIEIGMLAVTDDLQTEVAAFSRLVRISEAARARCDDFVVQMHVASGLWKDYDSGSPLSPEQAEQEAINWLGEHVTTEPPHAWGGSGVNHYDSGVLVAQMPRLRKMLRYKADFDVSAPRAFAALAGRPEIVSTEPCLHRALPDCRFALQQAQGYLAMLREDGT